MVSSKIDMVEDWKYKVNWIFLKTYLQNNDTYFLR